MNIFLNPEVSKQLKRTLNFSNLSLVGVVTSLLLFLSFGETNIQQSLADKTYIFYIAGILVSSWMITSGVQKELRGKTWDFVRTSSITPLELMTGYLMCGALGGLLIMVAFGLYTFSVDFSLNIALHGLTIWVIACLASIFVSATAYRTNRLLMLVGILAIAPVIILLVKQQLEVRPINGILPISFYGFTVSGATLLVMIYIQASIFLSLGIYRNLKKMLSYNMLPWANLLFIGVATIFITGLFTQTTSLKTTPEIWSNHLSVPVLSCYFLGLSTSIFSLLTVNKKSFEKKVFRFTQYIKNSGIIKALKEVDSSVVTMIFVTIVTLAGNLLIPDNYEEHHTFLPYLNFYLLVFYRDAFLVTLGAIIEKRWPIALSILLHTLIPAISPDSNYFHLMKLPQGGSAAIIIFNLAEALAVGIVLFVTLRRRARALAARAIESGI